MSKVLGPQARHGSVLLHILMPSTHLCADGLRTPRRWGRGGVRYARSVPAAQWSCEKRGVGCGSAPAKRLGDCGGKRRRQPQHGGASERDWAAGRRRPPGHFQKLPRSGALAHAPSFGQDASTQRHITSACRTRSDAQSKRCVGPALTPRVVFVALSQAKYP